MRVVGIGQALNVRMRKQTELGDIVYIQDALRVRTNISSTLLDQ